MRFSLTRRALRHKYALATKKVSHHRLPEKAERAIIDKRIWVGVAVARARGSDMGRRTALIAKKKSARYKIDTLNNLLTEVSRRYGAHPRLLTRALRQDDG